VHAPPLIVVLGCEHTPDTQNVFPGQSRFTWQDLPPPATPDD
jgi:hypothetical protein